MTQTDLIIIGAGPGGYRAAEHAAKHGLKVVVFEAGEVGGTCLNVGCIPTKTFARHAEIMLTLREAEVFGLQQLHYDFCFPQVVERKNQVIATLRNGIETLLASPNVTLVRARARFLDAHTVVANEDSYTAPHIIVATGSENKWLSGIEGCLTHEQLLDLPLLPRRLCIIGAGVIGMEFASIFSAFGVEVTVVEFLKECLPALDSDVAKRLRKVLEKRGVAFFMQAAVKRVVGHVVTFEDKKGALHTVEADTVLMAVGRKPRLQPDFAKAGFDYDERTGIKVDDHLQTTVEGVYAIGDVNGRQMLAHAAEMQGLHVVNQIVGVDDHVRFDIMPAAIFTHPEAACVGVSEDQCKQKGQPYECRKAFYRANGKALAMNETEGLLKLFSEPEGGRIIGCHAFGAHSADMVQEVASLMCRDTTVNELRRMVHIHPTLNEVLLSAAQL
jgi:dihydrolipoamide dehydrogenase